MNLGVSLNSPCYRSPYPPTNPISSRSPLHSETVVWSARTQMARLVTNPPQPRDEFIRSTSGPSATVWGGPTRTNIVQQTKTTTTGSRTNVSQCFSPSITTQCPPGNSNPSKGKTWGK